LYHSVLLDCGYEAGNSQKSFISCEMIKFEVSADDFFQNVKTNKLEALESWLQKLPFAEIHLQIVQFKKLPYKNFSQAYSSSICEIKKNATWHTD